jgi:hypothetical protein
VKVVIVRLNLIGNFSPIIPPFTNRGLLRGAPLEMTWETKGGAQRACCLRPRCFGAVGPRSTNLHLHPNYLLPRGSGYFSSQTFSRTIPHILNRSHTSYLLAYEDGTECSETFAFKLLTAENKPVYSIR